jgi:hypothetical protein
MVNEAGGEATAGDVLEMGDQTFGFDNIGIHDSILRFFYYNNISVKMQ